MTTPSFACCDRVRRMAWALVVEDDAAVAHPGLLAAILLTLGVACAVGGTRSARRAPGVAASLFGAVGGGIAGFLMTNADGPADVPVGAITGASVGLVVCGIAGLAFAHARPPARPLRRAAVWVLATAPVACAGLTVSLLVACPLYVNGPASGFCDFRDQDLLGGWVSGAVVAFAFDVLFLAGVLALSANQATDRATRGDERPGR